MSSNQTCIRFTHPVYAKCENVVYLRKQSHNRLSPRLCTKVSKMLVAAPG